MAIKAKPGNWKETSWWQAKVRAMWEIKESDKTECCGQWICDDEDKYVLFSYERNSCYRNHRRYTLCAFHHDEEHKGNWKDCVECRNAFETEIYVFYGTNEFNFEKLENPPAYLPTHSGSQASESSGPTCRNRPPNAIRQRSEPTCWSHARERCSWRVAQPVRLTLWRAW
jgi:hypothetical protein